MKENEPDIEDDIVEIAICHFTCIKKGKHIMNKPEIETDKYTENIATTRCMNRRNLK